MTYDPDLHNRRSIRMPGYDYTGVGLYYVTICVNNRKPILAKIFHDSVFLSNIGKIVDHTWNWLSEQHPYVDLDDYVLMPNHLHGIIVIKDVEIYRGGSKQSDALSTTLPTTSIHQIKRKTLGRLVGAFKTKSTKRINEMWKSPETQFWQRNYYEHIIRNEQDLAYRKEYIRLNPIKWTEDALYHDL